jgi:endonuclease G
MDTSRAARLEKYVRMISKRHGGIDGLLASKLFSPTEAPPSNSLESFQGTNRRLEDARFALENMSLNKLLSPQAFEDTEAIIAEDIRPAINISGGKFTSVHPLWTHLSTDEVLRTRIESLLPSIGRIELPGNKQFPYGGTGFVVGTGIIMTNRHVAEIFARGLGDRRLDFIAGAKAGIDFGRELNTPTTPTLTVRRVLMIHPYWDMALLEVEGLDARHAPLKLACRDSRDLTGTQVAVVGYPAFDPRNPADIQQNLFNRLYGVKRLQPGELQGATRAPSFGKFVNAAGHDCSTLGGNSGSAVLDLASGEVLGLHFGGVFHDVNYSVPAFALASDARVVGAGVALAGPQPVPSMDWAAWWTRADASEAPYQVAPAGVAAAGAEAMVEPEHDTDYSSRTGFSENFLGAEEPFLVALPQVRDASILAPTKDGASVLHYQNFSIVQHAARRLALFTASNITRETVLRRPEPGLLTTRMALSGLAENDREKWFLDPRMEARYQLPDVFFNKDRQAFDKGHIVRRDDVAWGQTYAELKRANGDSYHVTNCSPQVSGFNQSARGVDNWGDLENNVLSSAATERLTVFAGPILDAADQVFFGAGPEGSKINVQVPARFWKIIVSRSAAGLAAFGFVLDQDLADVPFVEYVVPDNFIPMLASIADIGERIGVDFGALLRAADQFGSEAALELVIRGAARIAA